VSPDAGFLVVVAAVLLVAGREAWSAHQRSLVNRALHEARRPLQAIALSMPAGPGRMTPALPVWQAIQALGEVDRCVNGGAADRTRPEPIACRLMVEACVRRWQSRARMVGAGIEFRWTGPEALVTGDPASLSGALENLIVNAIEHGGPRIVVRALVVGRRLRIEVEDGGTPETDGRAARSRERIAARFGGRNRHGHGLAVARTTCSRHGGRLDTELDGNGSRATMVLPCSTRSVQAGVPPRV
jgi:signal transduction histidine kinase